MGLSWLSIIATTEVINITQPVFCRVGLSTATVPFMYLVCTVASYNKEYGDWGLNCRAKSWRLGYSLRIYTTNHRGHEPFC